MKTLSGGKLAGGNPKSERVENDYYATNPKAVEMLLDSTAYFDEMNTFLEPCVGEGHIAKIIEYRFRQTLSRLENAIDTTLIDIVDRGYPNTIVCNFLEYETDKRFDGIITNPPYSLAKEFAEKGISLLNHGGHMAMFLKIQFLEGGKRKNFFEKYPPKAIYVFRNRMATWNNGQPINPNTGKKWATTICHAWFIWEKGYVGDPIIKWL